jgi:hypothetical protein
MALRLQDAEAGAMKHFALGRLPVGQMNKTEAKYASVLEALKRNGNILWYRFEGIKLRLADNTFYSPDFFVMRDDSVLECHEVKGFWMDDARVKIKVAADLYPFRFYAVKERARKAGGGYEYEVFGSVASASPETKSATEVV